MDKLAIKNREQRLTELRQAVEEQRSQVLALAPDLDSLRQPSAWREHQKLEQLIDQWVLLEIERCRQ